MASDNRIPDITAESDRAFLAGLGRAIAAARKAKKLSRKALGRRGGVSVRYIAQVEAGAGNISVLLLRRLASVLEIPLAGLFAGQSARQPVTGIALAGLRGAGKSTLGRSIADSLDMAFVELNQEIERASGLSATDIFNFYGKQGYRRLEHLALKELAGRTTPMVLAVSGGIVSSPQSYDLLLSSFVTVWLKAPPGEHMARVRAQGDERPMAGYANAMDDLKSILRSRETEYARCRLALETGGKSPAQSQSELLALLAGEGIVPARPRSHQL